MAKKGGGGSQLAQLKAKLRSEGITDRRQMKAADKKRKRGQAGNERDEAQRRRDRLEAISSSSSFNPFEEKITKPKNAVLGRKIRGATGKPGVAKMGGMRERTAHLLPEWMNRDKSGSFIDRRFGEGAGSMSNDEIMLERFTREQQKRREAGASGSRSTKTNLFDIDDDEDDLAKFGQALNDLEDYDDDLRLQDGEADMAGVTNGRFDDQDEDEDEDRPRSKAEVMKEVIAKSKAYKHERQQTKMADEDLREQLDEDFNDIRGLLSLATNEPESRSPPPMFGGADKKVDAYDAAVREMAYERRAKPQDRLKTEEEKAEELANQLREAEEKRLKRMRGEEVDDEEGSKRNKRSRRQAGGDDLEDDFELDGMTAQDVYGLGAGLEEDDDEDDDEGEEKSEDEGESSDEDDDEDDEAGETFEDLADLGGLAQPGEEDVSDAGEEEDLVARQGRSRRVKEQINSLPFTFQCPDTLDDFLETLENSNVQLQDVPTVLKRIRALHHPSLAENNKFKLQALIGVIIDYILHVSSQIKPDNRADTMAVINALVPQLFSLSTTYPVPASEHFVSKLSLMQRNLGRGLARGASSPDARTWPGLAESILLKITGQIWPTSDRSHAVTTPLALLLTHYLSACRVRHAQDLGRGLYLCALVAENERQSGRVIPEALNYLHNALALLAPITSRKQLARINQSYGIPWPDYSHELTAELCVGHKSIKSIPAQLDFVDMMSGSQSISNAQTKAALLSATFALIDEYRRLYMGSVAYVELFAPFETLLRDLIKGLPKELEHQRAGTLEPLARAVANAAKQRRALRLQAHRAIPLASHVPKFDQGFDPTRKGAKSFDPDAERAEQAKLRALLKKERKGAVRELRRDNEFLAEARRNAREEEDKRYGKAIDKIMGSLSAERGEEKAYLKEKQKLKRRAGKK